MWWTNGTRLPPLVTTSPQGTSVANAGVLGRNTTVLFGNETVGNDIRGGFRTTLGMWLDRCHAWSVEFDYLSLGERANNFSQGSTGDTILARPFFNTETNAQASELVAYPGVVEGTVSADTKNYFQSAGVTMGYNLCSCNSCCECDPCEELSSCGSCDPCSPCGPPMIYGCRTDLLVGFRYYNLSDRVGITENLLVTEPGPAFGTTFDIHDNFRARNDFYGSEIGLRTKLYRGRWSLDIMTKIAMGNNHQTITIDGQTAITEPPTTNYAAGILAGGTNDGTYERDTLTLIPQLSLQVGYQVSRHCKTYIGYDILYWGSVARAADQIDLNVDPRNFPPVVSRGLPFPEFPGKTDSFWAQGLNLGAEFQF